MNRNTPLSRREATTSLLLTLGALVGASALPEGTLRAEDAHLSLSDPKAMAVGYTEEAGHVEAKKYPSYAPGQTCENCLQLQGAPGLPYRPCTLFPGKSVAAAGWCSAWTPEL